MADLLSPEKSQDPLDLVEELVEELNLTPSQVTLRMRTGAWEQVGIKDTCASLFGSVHVASSECCVRGAVGHFDSPGAPWRGCLIIRDGEEGERRVTYGPDILFQFESKQFELQDCIIVLHRPSNSRICSTPCPSIVLIQFGSYLHPNDHVGNSRKWNRFLPCTGFRFCNVTANAPGSAISNVLQRRRVQS